MRKRVADLFGRWKVRHSSREIEADASPQRADMALIAFLERDQDRQRPGRVAGRDVEIQRRVAERQLLAVCRDQVFPGFQVWKGKEGLDAHVGPIGFRQHDMGTVVFLQNLRAEVVVAVAMGHNPDQPDRGGIQVQLLEAVYDERLDGIVVEGVDEDNSF